MRFRIVIPARYASSRLPGKPLVDLDGKSMIQRVYENACQSQAASVVIATEDDRIVQAAKKFGAQVCLTSADHHSGTDRVAEVTTLLNYEADETVVNVQGDQPFVPPETIDQVAKNLWQYADADMATLCERIHDNQKLTNPSVAKVVMDARGFALYFSRQCIPWSAQLDIHDSPYYQHVGIYAYSVNFIQQFVQWPISTLERLESLEQLRALDQGKKIHLDIAVKNSPPEINTPEDVETARRWLNDQY